MRSASQRRRAAGKARAESARSRPVAGSRKLYNALTLLLRVAKEENGWTIAQIARRSGLEPSTIGAYLSGQATGERPRPDTFRALAAGFKVPLEDLYEAAGVSGGDEERALVSLYRRLPTQTDRRLALTTLRSMVLAAESRRDSR